MIFLTEQLLKNNNKFLNLIDKEIALTQATLESQKTLKFIILEYMQKLATSTAVNVNNSSQLLKVLMSFKNSLELSKTNIINLENLINLYNDIKTFDNETTLKQISEINSTIIDLSDELFKNNSEILQTFKLTLSSSIQINISNNNPKEVLKEPMITDNIKNEININENNNNNNSIVEQNISDKTTIISTETIPENNEINSIPVEVFPENSETNEVTIETYTETNEANEVPVETSTETIEANEVPVETNTETIDVNEVPVEISSENSETQSISNEFISYVAENSQDINKNSYLMKELSSTINDVEAEHTDSDLNNIPPRNEENEEEKLSIQENTLIISEKTKKVFLPYDYSSVEEVFRNNPSEYSSIEDIIKKDFVLPLDQFKFPSISRFREAFKLMRYKENSSFKEALDLSFELLFNYNLHPAIISACRNLDELDIYLDYLADNETHKFSCFKIIFEVAPTLTKHNFRKNNIQF